MSKETIAPLETGKKKHLNRLPTSKEKAFAKEYAKTLNGTQSALKVYNVRGDKSVDANGYKTASAIATENLEKPRVRKEIERLLSENNIEITEIFSIHRRNMLQDKHLPTSQKAVDSFHELLGLKESAKTGNDIKIAFIIEK